MSDNRQDSFVVDEQEVLNLDSSKHYELLVLTPIFNQGAFTRRFIEHNSAVVDGMIFLDDGSTDDTYDLIHGDKVLMKCRRKREDVEFFDDRRTREFLYRLVVSGTVSCSWVLWLDSDELLTRDPERWERFRQFLRTAKSPNAVINFPLVHLIEDESQIWSNYPLTNRGVYRRKRMFRVDTKRPFRGFDRRLHFSVIPFDYTDADVAETDILVLHFGNIDPEARMTRYRRYRRNDPDFRYQSMGYEHLASAEEAIQRSPLTDVSVSATYLPKDAP